MRALITGASGFAGTHLTEHLLAEGDTVLGISQQGTWRTGAPLELRERVELLSWDIAQPPAAELRAQIEDFAPQGIYHLAALADPRQCGKEEPTPAAVAANVTGMRHVVELALAMHPSPRLLFTSSCHVYGQVSEENPVVREDSPLRPVGGYAATKQAAEEIVRRAGAERGLQAVVARAFHHAGPRQADNTMLAGWCRELAAEPACLRVKNRDSWLDWSDVRDVVRAYRLLMGRGRAGSNYNVGCGVPRRSGDLLARLLELYGQPVEVEEQSPGRRQEPIADIHALRADCGWQPNIPTDQTLADTLAWWREASGR